MIITGIDCKECVYKKKLEELEQENALLKEQLLTKSEQEQKKFDIEYKLNDELRYCSSDFRTIALAIYYLAKTIEEKKGAEHESNNEQ